MANNRITEPKVHHYVPKCWLAGFTETYQVDGRLWVTDLKRGKNPYPTTPIKAGRQHDFYRIDTPNVSPQAVEELYGLYETMISPTLKKLFKDLRCPDPEELDDLLMFMALQWVRVPAFTQRMLAVLEATLHKFLAKHATNPEAGRRALDAAKISLAQQGLHCDEGTSEHEGNGIYRFNATPEWTFCTGSRSMSNVLSIIRKREWEAKISPSGSFIGSDDPVAVDGESKTMVGFENAALVIYPVNRFVMLCSSMGPSRTQHITRNQVAYLNRLVIMRAHRTLYSHRQDFCWLDGNDTYQTGWNPQSRESLNLARTS